MENPAGMYTLHDSVRLAFTRPVVRRALKFAVVVGAILIAINHSDAILAGDVSGSRLVRMGLTVMVPYLVSALSSVAAIRRSQEQVRRAENGDTSGRPVTGD